MGIEDQIAFPVTQHRSIFSSGRTLLDRDGVRYPDNPVTFQTGMPRSPDATFASKLLEQLFFQCATRLDEQTAIDRFVGHLQVLVVRMVHTNQPAICCGDQNCWTCLATMRANARLTPSLHGLGRFARCQAA